MDLDPAVLAELETDVPAHKRLRMDDGEGPSQGRGDEAKTRELQLQLDQKRRNLAELLRQPILAQKMSHLYPTANVVTLPPMLVTSAAAGTTPATATALDAARQRKPTGRGGKAASSGTL